MNHSICHIINKIIEFMKQIQRKIKPKKIPTRIRKRKFSENRNAVFCAVVKNINITMRTDHKSDKSEHLSFNNLRCNSYCSGSLKRECV